MEKPGNEPIKAIGHAGNEKNHKGLIQFTVNEKPHQQRRQEDTAEG